MLLNESQRLSMPKCDVFALAGNVSQDVRMTFFNALSGIMWQFLSKVFLTSPLCLDAHSTPGSPTPLHFSK